MGTKNITVTVSEDIHRAARVRAAERGTSVSAMVTEYLQAVVGEDDEFARLERLQDEVIGEIRAFKGADRLDRDDVHRRAIR